MRDSIFVSSIVRRTLRTTPRLRLTVLVAATVLAVGAPRADAETFNVPCSLAALANVIPSINSNGEEDFLWLAPSCVYSLEGIWVVQPDGGNPLWVYARGATISGKDALTPLIVRPGATLHLDGATVRDGAATTGSGGAIRNEGTLLLRRTTVTSSTAASGAGLYNAGTARVSRSTVFDNASNTSGGGITNAAGARLTLIDSTVYDSDSTYGGGLYSNGRAALFNSTLFGNGAFVGGGILNESAGRLLLSHVTIARNQISSAGGGGIHNSGRLRIDDSIVADHEPGQGDCSNAPAGVISPLTSNLIEDGSCNIFGAVTGDPGLTGPTGTPKHFALAAGSPAIDTAQLITCPSRDQRGARRPFDGNQDGFAMCDLGAYERGGAACGLLGIEGLALLPWLTRLRRPSKRA